MSWEQSYSVPSVEELLEQLTNKKSYDLLLKELSSNGLSIVNSEQIILDDGFFQTVTGYKITLSDGRVFVPKLVKSETANGNWGCDHYAYVLENETPKVEYVNHDSHEEYDLTDEATLESDGELENDNVGC